MIDGEYLLHASGHHMATVIEPLADVSASRESLANRRASSGSPDRR
jgi:hypothetical protein